MKDYDREYLEQNEIGRMWLDGSLVGRRVKHNNQIRTVRKLFGEADVPGGVILDKHIDMFMYWNVRELTLVEDEGETS